jgi:hypothetical protein
VLPYFSDNSHKYADVRNALEETGKSRRLSIKHKNHLNALRNRILTFLPLKTKVKSSPCLNVRYDDK